MRNMSDRTGGDGSSNCELYKLLVIFFYVVGDPLWASGFDAWLPNLNSQV